MALTASDLEGMPRRDLQKLAKEHGVKANLKACACVRACRTLVSLLYPLLQLFRMLSSGLE